MVTISIICVVIHYLQLRLSTTILMKVYPTKIASFLSKVNEVSRATACFQDVYVGPVPQEIVDIFLQRNDFMLHRDLLFEQLPQ